MSAMVLIAAVWDAYWVARLLLVARGRPLSGLEVDLAVCLVAIHLVSIAVLFLRPSSWSVAVLAGCALAVAYSGTFYFYVVWPAGALLLAAAGCEGWTARRNGVLLTR